MNAQVGQGTRLKSVSDAESFAQRLRVVHTDQIYPSTHEVKRPSSPKVFQYLVAVMSAGVIVLTIAGLILGVRFGRPIWLVWVVLAFGVAVPVAVLWLGQQRS